MKTDFLITDISRISLVDKYEYKETFTSFTRDLKCNEIVFHFSGKSTLYFNNNSYKIVPNTVRFLPKGPNTRYNVHREEHGDCIFIDFNTDKPISDDAFVIFNQYTHKFAPFFKKIFSVWIAKDEGYYFECISILYKIFSELQKNNYIPEKQYLHIKPAINYINEHFLDESINIENLAEICDISYSYFKKIFMKKFNVSPKKYIIQLKLDYACELLKTKIYSVTTISALCGFDDVSFFSRQFKKYMGITPSDFAKKYKSSK